MPSPKLTNEDFYCRRPDGRYELRPPPDFIMRPYQRRDGTTGWKPLECFDEPSQIKLGPVPPERIASLEALEAQAQAKVDALATEKVRRRCAYRAHFNGYTNVEADAYTAQYWALRERQTLPVIASISGDDLGYDGKSQALRLPDGDIMVIIQGVSWARWTRDPVLIADYAHRSQIIGYRYDSTLCDALWSLEKTGALRHGCASWFGGTQPREYVEGAYAGGKSCTGPEKIARLRKWMAECTEANPLHAQQINDVLTLVTDTSITEIRKGG